MDNQAQTVLRGKAPVHVEPHKVDHFGRSDKIIAPNLGWTCDR